MPALMTYSDVEDEDTSPKNTRKSYSLGDKKTTVKAVESLISSKPGLTVTNAIKELFQANLIPHDIPHYYYKKWKKHIEIAKENMLSSDPMAIKVTLETKKLHPGRPSSLKALAGTVQRKIMEQRERGLRVSIRTVQREVGKLNGDFKKKSQGAKHAAVRRLVKANGFSQRSSTHVAQKHFKETELAAKAFITMAHDRVANMPHDAVANMDQTPTPRSTMCSQTSVK
jgi:hypothetical protein